MSKTLRGQVDWRDYALCANVDPELFFDKYESSKRKAKLADEICLSCPVRAQCLEFGQEINATGAFGGFWLTLGKIDNKMNAHKTTDVRKRMLQ